MHCNRQRLCHLIRRLHLLGYLTFRNPLVRVLGLDLLELDYPHHLGRILMAAEVLEILQLLPPGNDYHPIRRGKATA